MLRKQWRIINLVFVVILQLTEEVLAVTNYSSSPSNAASANETETTILGSIDNVRQRFKEKSSGSTHISAQFIIPPDGKGPNCRKAAKCEKLQYNTCFGVKLPYSSTTLDLVSDVRSQEDVLEKLSSLAEGLRQIPKCWASIQPLLCSLYMPRCEDDMVDLPSQEMCNITIWPCRTLLASNHWPSFPKCDDTSTFPPKCRNDVRELKFNTTGHCQAPLVQTDNSFAFYEGIEGCGVQCNEPLFTDHEQDQLYNVIGYGGVICLCANLFTVATFLIEWKCANKYPPLVIFYINCCFAVSCIGWLAQFSPNARQDIVCRKDGTLRMAEPSAVENLSCVIIFVLIYYPIIAGLVWFVILTYTWHISFQSVGKLNDNIEKKGVYFHMAAWSIPLILTITTMALGEIDGSSFSGICFVGYINPAYRIGFLWVPIFIAVFASGYFIVKVLYTLIMLKISSQDIVSDAAAAKIQKSIMRIAIFSLFMVILIVTSFVCHVYEFLNHKSWKDSLRKLIICKVAASSGLSSMDSRRCRLETRPSVSMFQLHLLVFFCAGITMSSWVWTSATMSSWKRFLRRTLCSEKEKPVRMKKHKAIAQAFANWKNFNAAGRLSISFPSSHEDPVGLAIDGNSIASADFSTTWAAALPTLMTRRGALIGGSATGSSQRSNSNSEISVNIRTVSVGTHQCTPGECSDSQLSVQISEVTATSRGRLKNWYKSGQRPFKRRKKSHMTSTRTGSLTSQESHLGTIFNNTAPFHAGPFFPTPCLTPSIPNIPNLGPLPFPIGVLDLTDDSDNESVKAIELKGVQDLVLKKEEENQEAEPQEDEPFLPKIAPLPLEGEPVQNIPVVAPDEVSNKPGIEVPEKNRSRTSEKSHSRNSAEHRESKHATQKSNSGMERLSRNADSQGRRSASKRKITEVQTCTSEESAEENEDARGVRDYTQPSLDITGLSKSSSFCSELMRLVDANSRASVLTHHTLGGGRVRTVGVGPRVECNDVGVQVSPREIATQTSASLENIEVHELYPKKLRSPQQFVSQGVQANPASISLLSHHPAHRQPYNYNVNPYNEKLPVPGPETYNYSYTLQRLVQELAEGHPWNFMAYDPHYYHRNTGHNRNGYRSRSAEEKIDGSYVPV